MVHPSSEQLSIITAMERYDSITSRNLKTIHNHLARNYQMYRDRVREIWTDFPPETRVAAVNATKYNLVLKTSTDRSLSREFRMASGNLEDLTAVRPGDPNSDYILQALDYRATHDLYEQYITGPGGGPGDAQAILESEQNHNIRHTGVSADSFTIFASKDNYGHSYQAPSATEYNKIMARNLDTLMMAGSCVPASTGELIMGRQLYLMEAMILLIDYILEIGSKSRAKTRNIQKDMQPAEAALVSLSIKDTPKRASLDTMVETASEYKSMFDGNLDMLRTDPMVLTFELSLWGVSRPELVKDEKGRVGPAAWGKYTRSSFFELVHSHVVGTANWNYINSLLRLMRKGREKEFMSFVIPHLSNACHLEFLRAQRLLKRQLQGGSGKKHFKRLANVFEKDGSPRVSVKGKPGDVSTDDVYLGCLVQLCHGNTKTAVQATEWISTLEKLHAAVPDKLTERDLDALNVLVLIVSFTRTLGASLSLPPPSVKKGRLYGAESDALADELGPLKDKLNILEVATPIDNLREPGMADAAFTILDKLVVAETGARLDVLYKDQIQACLADIEMEWRRRLEAKKTQATTTAEAQPQAQDVPTTTTSPPESDTDTRGRRAIAEQRREKQKTRPAPASSYTVDPAAPLGLTSKAASPNHTKQAKIKVKQATIKVKPSTYETFAALFDKSEAQGSMNWSSFVAAMVDARFGTVPKFGSVVTFTPPADSSSPPNEEEKQDKTEDMPSTSITLHRPHGPRIEGYKMRYLARRLARTFGWGIETFEPV